MMRPNEFPNKPDTPNYSRAEKLFFEQCRSLPNTWFVLFGVHWFDAKRCGVWKEGDFVVVGPDVGLIVIEIKGGGVGCSNGVWYSIDHTNRQHHIRHPVEQVKGNGYAILDYLKGHCKDIDWQVIPFTLMVSFPNTDRRVLPSCIELIPELILCSNDLESLQSLLLGGVRLANRLRTGALTREQCRRIADSLKPSFEPTSRWSARVFEQEYEIKRLTEGQKEFVESAERNRRIAVTGPAGSGKTVAVVLLLKEVLKKGQSVLSVVPSTNLRAYYQAVLGTANHDVLLLQDIPDEARGQWQVIVCDEAQDATPEQLRFLVDICDKQDARLILIHDSNQRLSRQVLWKPSDCREVILRKVLRNTSQIGELSTRFYLSEDIKPEVVGPVGMPVKHIEVKTKEDIPNEVARFVLSMVNNEGFGFGDCVVLFGSDDGKWMRRGGRSFEGITFRDVAKVWPDGYDDSRCIACGNVSAFRGMESPVVILCEVDDLIEQDLIEPCYVGMSRAKFVLAVVGLGRTLERVRTVDLGCVASERIQTERRYVKRVHAAEKAQALLSVGALCLGEVRAVKPFGVFVRLVKINRDGLVRRERITAESPYQLDLNRGFRVGESRKVRIEKIDPLNGYIDLSFTDPVIFS